MESIINYHSRIIRANLPWLKLAAKIFLVTFVIGILAYIFYPHLIEDIIAGFEERFGSHDAMSFGLAIQIFLQNLMVSMIALIGGILIGISPLLVLIANGLIIGYVFTWIVAASAANLLTAVLLIGGGLLPHGILEIPAFLLASGLGLRLGWEWISKGAKGQRDEIFMRNLKTAFISIPFIALVLFIAALIEVFISGWIVSKL